MHKPILHFSPEKGMQEVAERYYFKLFVFILTVFVSSYLTMLLGCINDNFHTIQPKFWKH